MSHPSVSVIVRTKNEASGVRAALTQLRRQTVPSEIVVVDSGSTDGTLDIVRPLADRLLTMPAHHYTPGRSLNLGAAAASGSVHMALSAHCVPPDERWIERSIAHYDDSRVAATNGGVVTPEGKKIHGVYLQDAEHTRSYPMWGFSNHASSWRADVWRTVPFDESLFPTAEDRKWSWEVIDAGWLIAFDQSLTVDMSHRWRAGMRAYFRRVRDENVCISLLAPLPPYPARDALRDWWSGVPDDGRGAAFHRANPRRWAEIAGRFVGRRTALAALTR